MAEKLQQIEQLSDALNVKIDGIFDNGAELASLKALQSEGYTVEKKITVVYHPIQTSEVIPSQDMRVDARLEGSYCYNQQGYKIQLIKVIFNRLEIYYKGPVRLN